MDWYAIKMAIVLVIVSGLVFRSLNRGWLKNYYLQHRDLTTGYWAAAILAIVIACLCGLVGSMINHYVMIIGWIGGLFLGAWAGTTFYNAGIGDVPTKMRAVPVWRGMRQQGFELTEGRYWFFPYFFTAEAISMEEQTTKVLNIPIEVQDENVVPTDVSIQWTPRAGSLYYFQLLGSQQAFETEIQSIVRAFGVSRDDIDHLIDGNFPEILKTVVLEALTRRAEGIVSRINIDRDGVARFEEIRRNNPWGITINSANVPNFTLPKPITDAAAEEAEAKRRTKASKLEIDAMDGIIDVLVSKRNINPTAAASFAASMVLPPDKRPSIHTNNQVIGGLDNLARTVINGILLGIGKEPLPAEVITPPPAPPAAAQQPQA